MGENPNFPLCPCGFWRFCYHGVIMIMAQQFRLHSAVTINVRIKSMDCFNSSLSIPWIIFYFPDGVSDVVYILSKLSVHL